MILFPSFAKILIADNAFLYLCNIFWPASQMHFWFLFSNAISNQAVPGSNQTPGKIQTGGVEDILFWKRFLEFLDLSLYPWKFQTKWNFIPENSNKSCHTHWNFQSQKPRPMEFPHYFFLDHAWEFHFFFYRLLDFPDSIFSVPLEISCPHPPPSPTVFFFFWNSPWCVNSLTNKNL